MFDEDDFLEDEFVSDHKSNDDRGKGPDLPFVPKEEEMSEEELERYMEERYKKDAGFVTYAEDGYDNKKSIENNIYVPSAKDPSIWKVKCVVGRERYSAFCLMQKYVDMEFLGNKLPIISTFAPELVKGFIFIETDKQNDIYEACKGISTMYPTKVTSIPSNEFSRLLSIRSKSSGISKGAWARVKSGKYKGDLALVVAVNDARKKVTVKLIPRIDLKAMAAKFGGGVAAKRTVVPPQRLISSSELDKFRPLIHSRRDRDTNQMVDVFDSVMLKDGYVYKKVSIDSLSFWGVVPTDDELLKFEPSKDDSSDVQWLSQLFGEKKKEHVESVVKQDKGSGKSEGSTSASTGNNFELNDLVFFGRKDFGVVIGQEKDDSVKVIKEGSDGPSVVTVKQSDLKSASFDKKLFCVLDQHSNTISINDSVRVLDGQLKENHGYICIKAQLCEKTNLSGKESHDKGNELGLSGFADLSLSPKSPLSPDKSCRDTKISFSVQREDDAMFSVGQSLRIRVGPLKGYLCRVLAIRRSDVTVKLDSQQRILTVKCEHLSEICGRKSDVPQGEETGSIKPFDFLGTQEGACNWTSGPAVSAEGNKWNAGGSTERSSWSTFDSSNTLISKEPGSADPVSDYAKKGTEDSSWQIKASNESSSWGVSAVEAKQDTVLETGTFGGWGTSSGWNQAVNVVSDSWGKAAAETPVATAGDTSGRKSSWGQSGSASPEKQTGGWNAAEGVDQLKASSWNKDVASNESLWGKIGDMKKDENSEGWSKADNPTKGWDTKTTGVAADSGSSWGKNEKSAWGKSDNASSGSEQGVGSSWNKSSEKSAGAWGSAKPDEDNNTPSGWNTSKVSNNNKASSWAGAGAGNAEAGNRGGSWDKVLNPNDSSKWNAGTNFSDGNKSSDCSTKDNWGSSGSEGKCFGGSWKNTENDVGGGSSTGSGQNNWGKGGSGVAQESGWGGKSNWNSGGGFDEADNNSDKREGGGGRWSGGRGGRGDHGGFRGRERSDFGENWNSERWKNSGGGSSWKQTDNGNNQHQSWGSSSQEGNWKQGGSGDKNDGGWGKSKADERNNSKDGGPTDTGGGGWESSPGPGGWNKPSPNKVATGGWNNNNLGRGESN